MIKSFIRSYRAFNSTKNNHSISKLLLNQCNFNLFSSSSPPPSSTNNPTTNTSKKSHQQQHYFQNRLSSLSKNSSSKQIYYPQFKPTISINDFITKYKDLKAHSQTNTKNNNDNNKEQVKQVNTNLGQENKDTIVPSIEKVSGRISSIRKHGKTIFIDIRQQHKKLQLALKNSKAEDQLQFRRGDIIGAQGIPFVTKKGQLTLEILKQQNLQILSPCLWMLPEYNTLKDHQVRYRKKYLDLITNPQSLDVLRTRSKVISELRKQLQSQGYIQVQTPVISTQCGGAIAKPFTTYHNDHKMNLYMRIAPELYLKKLIIGGFNKVFEIGKNFRNQSIDQTHNPQFTTCELYCAYSDYEEMMKFTQNLIKKIVFNVTGSYKLKVRSIVQGKVVINEIDLQKPWKVFDFLPDLQKQSGIKLPSQYQTQQSRLYLDKVCKQHNVDCDQPRTAGRLLDKLCGKYLQQKTLEPFFIINQPRILSPLAKPHEGNDKIVKRFQLFINGWEVVNSYTELNSPFVQKENTPNQNDFVQALEYGLPPTGGWGIGLDRLVMLVTGKQRIQEVIAFPLLRNQAVDQISHQKLTDSKQTPK